MRANNQIATSAPYAPEMSSQLKAIQTGETQLLDLQNNCEPHPASTAPVLEAWRATVTQWHVSRQLLQKVVCMLPKAVFTFQPYFCSALTHSFLHAQLRMTAA